MADRDNAPVLCIIVPCYIEAPVLADTNRALKGILRSMKERGEVAGGSHILYVDDRSTDSTWDVICSLADDEVKGVRLSRNCGHQCALLAGMEHSRGKCDVCVTIDADLQDDAGVMPEMLASYLSGADVVLGVREERRSDSWLKRSTAQAFYRVMRALGVDCLYYHADYRLLSARAMSDLLEYDERNLFLRGIVPCLGYRQDTIPYRRGERKAGESKYPFRKMLDFAVDGITSFSVRPVRMLFLLGALFMAVALGMGVYTLVRHFGGETIEGWTSLMLSIWFCTGILLIGMGITGEYIGKIYIEVKRRPRYKIAETI